MDRARSLSHLLPGLEIDCLGDCGPFSLVGESIGYRIRYRGAEYLLDCGFPLFRKLGLDGVAAIRGILLSHSHDDHRRWLTDFALFRHYSQPGAGRPLLISTDEVVSEAERMCRPTMERTLSADSRTVIGVSFDKFFEARPFGPAPRFRVVATPGATHGDWRVVDREGAPLPPHRAKAVLNPRDRGSRPRMLLADPASGLWVDPDLYYSYEDLAFYDSDPRAFVDAEVGLTFRAVRDTSWHGLFGASVLVETPDERVFFSSDTVFDLGLWANLASRRELARSPGADPEFLAAEVVSADINDYIEQTWSRDRFERARKILEEVPIVIHDVAARDSVVHTDYPKLRQGRFRSLFLVHSPDRFVSSQPLGFVAPSLRAVGSELYQAVGDRLFHFSADVYARDMDKAYVGFRNPHGAFEVVEDRGLLDLTAAGMGRSPLFRVDLYRVVGGAYYPVRAGRAPEYRVRPDGSVEELVWGSDGSSGKVVEDERPRRERSMSLFDMAAGAPGRAAVATSPAP